MAETIHVEVVYARPDRQEVASLTLPAGSTAGQAIEASGLLARYPETFAAGIAMCGAGEVTTAKNFAGKTAFWLFHGDKDQVVPTAFSQQYYRKLRKAGATVRYTEYKNTGHNCWSNALAEPDLLRWLFAQVKQ